MANFKLGAIFSDIAGSVGGTTFRRTPRGLIGYNKQGTQIKSAYAKNNKRAQLANIFRSWSSLSSADKNVWKDKALLYPQLNKFGDTVYLTGRQFYTKLNAQSIAINQIPDINNWVDTIQPLIVNNIFALWNIGEFNIQLNNPLEDSYMLAQVYPLTRGGSAKPTAHFYNTAVLTNTNDTLNDIGQEVASQFPFLRIGDKVGVNIYFMSITGFRSAVQSFEVVLGVG